MKMKQLIGVAFLGSCLPVLGCGSNLGDSCENTWTCSPPCGDATFAQAHPELCPADGGARDTSVVEDRQGSDDRRGSEDGGSSEDSSVGSADESDAGTPSDGTSNGLDGTASEEAAESAVVLDARAEAEAAPPCDPTGLPSFSACVVDDRFGIFVSPLGNDSNGGTRAAPVRSIGHALALAKAQSKRVYACDDGAGYTEAVTLDATLDGVSLFGAFRCGDWTYVTTQRATIRSPDAATPAPALTVRSTTLPILIENFTLSTPGATTPGASSLGVTLDTVASVILRRVTITSGDGAPGRAGMSGGRGDSGPVVGAQQRGLTAFCGPEAGISQPGGGWPARSTCGSQGGAGGTATNAFGGPGFPGVPQTSVTPPNINNRGLEGGGPASAGGAGSPGNTGAAGTSTGASGTFMQLGYSPALAANAGGQGLPGQGGGGGGASNAPDPGGCIGASGGAGGMGGCGGLPGTGGSGGGASVALFVWQSNVTLDTCILRAGQGGAGGQGGNGGPGGTAQAGAAGGAGLVLDGGSTILAGGSGGPGGNGGSGGPGAGGNGGPSYALASRGTVPSRSNTTLTPGQPGGAGQGGTAAATGNDAGIVTGAAGNPGLAAPELSVPAEAGTP